MDIVGIFKFIVFVFGLLNRGWLILEGVLCSDVNLGVFVLVGVGRFDLGWFGWVGLGSVCFGEDDMDFGVIIDFGFWEFGGLVCLLEVWLWFCIE